MSDAALEVDSNMPPVDEAEVIEEKIEAESAPAEQVDAPVEPELSARGQERFNKITADKYAEKRRADAAEERIKELESTIIPNKPVSDSAPTLESFDYDESKYNEALIDYKVNQKALEIQQQQAAESAKVENRARAAAFNAKVAKLTETAADYQEVVGGIPQLPTDTLNAIMQAEKGPELAYYLGKHLDVADEIASASPFVAAMRLGEISAKLGAVQTKTVQSAAPDPIEPISSGGSLSKDMGEMSMEEIYNL